MQILETHCFECHGRVADGVPTDDGGFGSILDVEGLVRHGTIVRGNAEASPLFTEVSRGRMPRRRPHLDPAEVETLRAWIAAGAPTTNSGAVPPVAERVPSDAAILAAIRRDALALPLLDLPHTRYFTLGQDARRGSSDAARTRRRELADALALLLNSLSWEPVIARPVLLAGGYAARIDLRHFGWDRARWTTLVTHYPYGYGDDGRSPSLCDLLDLDPHAAAAVVRADWFVATASRAPMYDTLLSLPATAAALEQFLDVDVAANIAQGTARRAGFSRSGVALHNRVVERHEARTGAYWRSYDFASDIGLHNVHALPLGPGSALGFVPSGGEAIFTLPNGLQGYMVFGADGRRLAEAPVAIVADRGSPRDPTVRNGLSCFGCHGEVGIREARDEVRASVETQNLPGETVGRVRTLYAGREEFAQWVAYDGARYARALRRIARRLSTNTRGAIAEVYARYDEPLDLDAAASELSTDRETLRAELARPNDLARFHLGVLATPGTTVSRAQFEQHWLIAAVAGHRTGSAIPSSVMASLAMDVGQLIAELAISAARDTSGTSTGRGAAGQQYGW